MAVSLASSVRLLPPHSDQTVPAPGGSRPASTPEGACASVWLTSRLVSQGPEFQENHGHSRPISLAWEARPPSLGKGFSGRGLGQADPLDRSLVSEEELGLDQASGTEGGWVGVSLGPGKDVSFCLVLCFS